MSRARRRAERRGRLAETIAALSLMLRGYRIVARRARTPYGEVDIAARKADVLAIVEVKARPSFRAGLDAIPHRNRKRIAQAGMALAQSMGWVGLRHRYDLMVVTSLLQVRHVRDAWRLDG